ncbi:transcription termination factor NusA [Nodosilinea sp. AN01ver1]|uniref:transcription termination factor NusA n=1 Tax=Nodosilinea sp. AN01ver1 TaxID=3423362 RepID=UPI003D31795F
MSLVNLPNLQEMIDVISRERNLPKHAVENALREALLKGYERYRRTREIDTHFDEEYFDNFDIELDVDDYDDQGFRVLATKTIVDEVTSQDHEIALSEVREVAPEAQAGDTVVLDVTPDQRDFGRMAAIQTKQVLAQKLRDQQRKLVQEEFQDLEGSILSARVLRFERQSVIMAVSSGVGQPEVEAELLKRDQLPNDNYRANATFRVALKKVSEGSHRGPQLLVSRADAALVVELFTNEVPEIEDEIVRIVAVAREANPPSRSVGPRTKIAVDTLERDVDPVGACIGARGSRIQVVVNELRGEKIDVIRWSPDPATYISNALSPARVDEVRLVNPDDRQAHVLVPEDQLSLAIGKEGQNVRLAARLTGWKIDIKDSGKYNYEEEDRKIADLIAAKEAAAAEAAELAAEEAEAAAWRAAAEAERAAAQARAAGLDVDEATADGEDSDLAEVSADPAAHSLEPTATAADLANPDEDMNAAEAVAEAPDELEETDDKSPESVAEEE